MVSACLTGYRPTRLFNARACEPDDCYLRRIRLAGRYLAFERFLSSREGEYIFRVVVYDLRARRLVYRSPSDGPPDQGDAAPHPGLTDLVLTTGGATAWIAAENQPGRRYVARTADATGRTRDLDAGDAVQPGSLALAGHRVYWMRDGNAQTASI